MRYNGRNQIAVRGGAHWPRPTEHRYIPVGRAPCGPPHGLRTGRRGRRPLRSFYRKTVRRGRRPRRPAGVRRNTGIRDGPMHSEGYLFRFAPLREHRPLHTSIISHLPCLCTAISTCIFRFLPFLAQLQVARAVHRLFTEKVKESQICLLTL